MLLVTALLALAAPSGDVPPGLDLRAVVEERTHEAVVQVGTPFAGVERALQAPNREHDLRAYFLPGAVHVRQRSDERCGWRVELALVGVGRAGRIGPVAPAAPQGRGCFVEYRRGALTEWYLNGPGGLEQGFTLEERPVDAGELELRCALGGNLAADVDADGVTLRGAAGADLRFAGLWAEDAVGRALPARFEPRPGGYALLVDDRHAVYPVTVDPLLVNVGVDLLGPSVVQDLRYGTAVDVHGTLAAVGGPGTAEMTGAVHVLFRQGGFWFQSLRLVAPGGEPGDRFGEALALRSFRLVVGAPGTDQPGQPDAGQAYVYSGFNGQALDWKLEQTLPHPDPIASDEFGRAVALREDMQRLYVGAPLKNWGKAYLYTRSGSAWTNVNAVEPSGAVVSISDEFASSISFSDALHDVLIGAPGQTGQTGAVYAYADTTATVFRQRIQPADLQPGDRFGESVAHDGRWAVFGAHLHDAGGADAGAAYVYEQITTSGPWAQRHKIVGATADARLGRGVDVWENGAQLGRVAIGAPRGGPAKTGTVHTYRAGATFLTPLGQLFGTGTGQGIATGDRFGRDVGIDGDSVAVGVPRFDFANESWGVNTGLVQFFEWDGASWNERFYDVVQENMKGDLYGDRVAVDGGWAAVAADRDDTAAADGGAVYLLERVAPDNWRPRQKLTRGALATSGANFGQHVELRGNRLYVLDFKPGQIVEYTRSGGVWTETQVIQGSGGKLQSTFDVDGDRLITMADGGPGEGYDAAYVFERVGGVWTERARFFDPTSWVLSPFGGTVAIEGDLAVVGSPGDDGLGQDAGVVHVFAYDGTSWAQEPDLRPAGLQAFDSFGRDVDLSGGVLAAASTVDVGSINPGAVHVFLRTAGGWGAEELLTSPNLQHGGAFGRSIDFDGDLLAVGAYREDVGSELAAGRAYVFQRFVAGWTPIAQLEAFFPQDDDYLGSAVDLSGARVAVGAPGPFPISGSPKQGEARVYDVTPVDALVYCTSKTNSQGCLPSIGWSGTPSASAGSGFDVFCLQNRDGVNGTFFYSVVGPKASPYQGGYLCVRSPAKRTGIQNSGGLGPCSGEFHFDFNARIASGIDPSLVAGTTVWGQYWSRDAQASFGSNRSDAIEFTIQP